MVGFALVVIMQSIPNTKILERYKMAEKEFIERGALIAEIDRNEPSNWTDTEAEIQSILDYRLYNMTSFLPK